MNPDNTNQTVETAVTGPVTKTPHPVNQVTSLSKYLAMVIFILMPFVGGYIGYRLAPERVVEVSVLSVSQGRMSDGVPSEKNNFTASSTSDPSEEVHHMSNEVVQLNATSTSRYIIEQYFCETALNVYEHTCYRARERSTSEVALDDLTDKAIESGIINATGSRDVLESVLYMTKDGSRFYFNVGVPDTDGGWTVVALDVNTLTISFIGDFYSSMNLSHFSSTNRYIASVAEDNKTIRLSDLEVGKVIKTQTVTKGNLIYTHCGFMDQDEASITFNETTNSFTYGIYTDGLHSKYVDDGSCYNDKIGEGVLKI